MSIQNDSRMTRHQKKPDTKTLTPKEADALIAKYAKMKSITVAEARCALIASGWRRLQALHRYATK